MDTVLYIPIGLIRVSAKQARKVCPGKVDGHVAALEAGHEPLPIDVHKLDDGSYTIAGNGRHRYFAYLAAGYATIPVRVGKLWKDIRRLIGRLLRILGP